MRQRSTASPACLIRSSMRSLPLGRNPATSQQMQPDPRLTWQRRRLTLDSGNQWFNRLDQWHTATTTGPTSQVLAASLLMMVPY